MSSRRAWGTVPAAALAAVLTAGLAGCGSPAPDAAQDRPPGHSAPSTPVPQAAPTGTALLWPVTDLPGAQALQTAVDGGSQPWTLDPAEVAVSYADQAYGWTDPQPRTTAPGTVELTDPRGSATVTLVQPVRAGATGIWVVSSVSRP